MQQSPTQSWDKLQAARASGDKEAIAGALQNYISILENYNQQAVQAILEIPGNLSGQIGKNTVVTGVATEDEVSYYFKNNRQYWTSDPVNFNGNKVYQRNDLIDPNLIDSKTGKTNLELMQAGRAPIGPDGNPINLHHMTQTQDGPIAELTQTFHQSNSAAIHVNTNDIPSGINRTQFNAWWRAYWMNRATDF